MEEKVTEVGKALGGIGAELWKSAASIGIGLIFDDFSKLITPKSASKIGRVARTIGAFTAADAICDKLTDSYIDKRFDEMKEKLEASIHETEEDNDGLHEAAK